jgi:phage terminase large subunit-like protein
VTAKPILEFSTLAPERPKILIDGELYELRVLADFGLLEQSRLSRLMVEGRELERIVEAAPPPASTGDATTDAALAALDAVGEAEAKRVNTLLDESIELILRAPADVRARLSEIQKRQIIEAFTPTVGAATPTATNGRRTRTSPSTSGGS